MSEAVVIVGSGPSGVRAAAWWRGQGAQVTYLAADGVRRDPALGELAGVDAPISVGGLFSVTWGTITRAVFAAGTLHAVPLTPTAAAALLPPTAFAAAAKGWLRARARGEMKKLVGGGNETRGYQDWVIQSLGDPVYRHIFAPYARKRFGDPEKLSANVARYLHDGSSGDIRDEARVVRDLSTLEGVRVVNADGAVARIERDVVTTGGGERLEGRVFVDLAPRRVLDWIPVSARAGMVADADALPSRDLVRVRLAARGTLPAVTDVIDASVPFFRVMRESGLPGGEGSAPTAIAVMLLGMEEVPDHEIVARVTEGLARMGVVAELGGASVDRLRDAQPVWEGPHLARARRHVEALAGLGVTPIGRAGLHAPLDPCEEVAYLDGVAGGMSVREAVRAWVEPGASAVVATPRVVVPVVR